MVYREELNDKQIEIYDLYSDFMIYFPDIGIDARLKKNIVNGLEYYHQFYFSMTSVMNFYNSLPNNMDKKDKIKLKYSAARCFRLLLNYNYGLNKSNLFELIDFTKKDTVYYDANEFNRKFVESLNEKSELFLFFIQINSGSSINLITNELTSRISMLDENTIKRNLISTIPKYGTRLLINSHFTACTFTEVRITCICEISLLNSNLSGNDILSSSDYDYNSRYLLANLMQQEDFGHLNFSINFYAFFDKNIKRPSSSYISENLSPIKYYMINEKKEKIQEIAKLVNFKGVKKDEKDNKEAIIKGDSGIALKFFLTRGKYKLMKVLRRVGINFLELFQHPELEGAEELTELINGLTSIYNKYNYLFMYDEDDDIDTKTRFREEKDSGIAPYGIPKLEKYDN